MKSILLIILIITIYSFNLYSKNFLESDKLENDLLYWKYLLNEELISSDEFLLKKKETLNSISAIKANNNVELQELLSSWNLFFDNLYSKNIISKKDYEIKLQESTKYITINFQILTKEDLKEQLIVWKSLFENNIISKIQYEKEKGKLLKLKLNDNIKIDTIKSKKLEKLKSLYLNDLINKDEYEIKKREILNSQNTSNNLNDFPCIKNFSTMNGTKKVTKKMCFCLNQNKDLITNAYYVIERTFGQKKFCNNDKAISYGNYITLTGNFFHNEDSIGTGGNIKILSEQDIANLKNQLKIKKLELELKKQKKRNVNLRSKKNDSSIYRRTFDFNRRTLSIYSDCKRQIKDNEERCNRY